MIDEEKLNEETIEEQPSESTPEVPTEPVKTNFYYKHKTENRYMHTKHALSTDEVDDLDDFDEVTAEEYEALVNPPKTQEQLNREQTLKEIAQLKRNLANTDYIVLKLSEAMIEGDMDLVANIKTTYAEELSNRAIWRARINELEK